MDARVRPWFPKVSEKQELEHGDGAPTLVHYRYRRQMRMRWPQLGWFRYPVAEGPVPLPRTNSSMVMGRREQSSCVGR